jgi:hypothetical protein
VALGISDVFDMIAAIQFIEYDSLIADSRFAHAFYSADKEKEQHLDD